MMVGMRKWQLISSVVVLLAGCGGTPTSSDATHKLKKTRQTKSYDGIGAEVTDASIKDDGFYQTGVEPNYTRNDATGIVTDNITGLQWQDNNDTKSIMKPWLTRENFDSCRDGNKTACTDDSGDTAATYCKNLSLGGHKDWRLPTIDELMYIVDRSKAIPAIDRTYFHNLVVSNFYWSSTVFVGDKTNAWVTEFYYGVDFLYGKHIPLFVRCVRVGH